MLQQFILPVQAIIAASGEEAAAPELPNVIHLFHSAYPHGEAPWLIQFLYNYQNQLYAFAVVLLIALFFNLATRKCTLIPSRFQALAEMIVEGLYDMICGMLGEKDGRRYFPFFGTLFIFILCMNWFGLIPLMKSPTSSIYTTASLAGCVFVYVQYIAITRLGPMKFIYHLMGEPKDIIGWCLVPLFLPLHIMEEFIKPLSLACRLFGNVFGEDVLLGVALTLGILLTAGLGSLAHLPFNLGNYIGIPFQFPFIFLALLTSTIQALVFALLAVVYISMVLPHEEHSEH